VYSLPRVGKTTFACSDDKILLLNAEVEGEVSAARSAITGKNVKQWKIFKYEDFQKAKEWLKELVRQGKPMPFNWVVVDTLSTLQDRQLMRYVLDKMLVKKPDRNKYIPDKPEYLENQLILVQDVKELCDLPVNMVFLAHQMEQEDAEGNPFVYPQIQGGKYKVAQQILAMTTSYGYMTKETRKKDGKVVTREGKPIVDRVIQWEDKTGVLGQRTRNVTLRQIRERMEQENAKYQAAQQESKG
jgi:hypothetical protein